MLELLNDSVTNEKRDLVIDDKYAKFRCNKAKVISIKNVKTGELMKNDRSIYDWDFVYRVGEVVDTWFSRHINIVCSGGIHYFKTEEAALSWFYRQTDNKFPDGKWTTWHENGHKKYFKDGKKDEKWTRWYENGNKNSEGAYKDGKLDGKWIDWHENGQKQSERTYKDGKIYGNRLEWWSNGNKKSDKDMDCDGKWTYWHENGNKKSEGPFKNGKRDGKWIKWYDNGHKKSEKTYINGKKDGKCTWYDHVGKIYLEGTYKMGNLIE